MRHLQEVLKNTLLLFYPVRRFDAGMEVGQVNEPSNILDFIYCLLARLNAGKNLTSNGYRPKQP